MNLKKPLPFAYETFWFCLGALMLKMGEPVAIITLGFMTFGGLFGAMAYNHRVPDQQS